MEATAMSVRVKVDQQGRIVLPQRERERLGVATGGTLDLIATPEGVLLEPRHTARVRTADDGVPLITIEGIEQVTNEESLDAIHQERERP
jgi:AbrB family looped-hinge helix DNA binding protein